MTVYFAGTEIMDFVTNGIVSSYIGRNNVSNTRNSVYTQSGSEDTNYMDCTLSTSVTSLWMHAVVYFASVSAFANHFLKWYSGGTQKLGCFFSATGIISVAMWNGTSWTTILTASSSISAGLYTLDVRIVLGNPGTLALYVDGVPLVSSTSLDLSSITNLDAMRLQPSNNAIHYSEVIVADWNTVGARIISQGPTGAGNYSQWTNTYTSVDEAGDGGTDYITSGTADQRQSFTYPAITLGTGESIAGVGTSIEGFSDLTSPQHINLFARVAATDYDDVDQSLPTSMSYTTPKIWAVNPNTSAAWAASEVNAAEFGVRSRT